MSTVRAKVSVLPVKIITQQLLYTLLVRMYYALCLCNVQVIEIIIGVYYVSLLLDCASKYKTYKTKQGKLKKWGNGDMVSLSKWNGTTYHIDQALYSDGLTDSWVDATGVKAPWSLDSAWANSSRWASIRSAILLRTWARCSTLRADQSGKASLAAATAASTWTGSHTGRSANCVTLIKYYYYVESI